MSPAEALAWLVPPGLPAWAALSLAVLSFFTSALTATFGLGGGVVMLACMAQAMPAHALIPVHAVIQLGSNAGRAVVMRRDAAWAMVPPFAAGTALGVALGGWFNVTLPAAALQAAVGAFVLWAAFGQAGVAGTFGKVATGRAGLIGGGAAASFLTMFVGATGPFTAAVLRRFDLQRQAFVGTFALCMTLQHGLKIAAFGVLGFAFGPWLPFLALTIASGFLGTLTGKRLLDRFDEAFFKRALKLILIVLGAELLLGALWRLWA